MLDQLENKNGLVSAGQLNGNFAVWAKCNPYPRCQIFRYDLASASTTPVPATDGKVVYSPSVNEYGTVYYGQSNRGCGSRRSSEAARRRRPRGDRRRLPLGRDARRELRTPIPSGLRAT